MRGGNETRDRVHEEPSQERVSGKRERDQRSNKKRFYFGSILTFNFVIFRDKKFSDEHFHSEISFSNKESKEYN